MGEKEVIPDLLSEEELRGFTPQQLVSRFAGARLELCYGKAMWSSGQGYTSKKKLERWEQIERQLEKELLRRLEDPLKNVQIDEGRVDCPYCGYGQEADPGEISCERCHIKFGAIPKDVAITD